MTAGTIAARPTASARGAAGAQDRHRPHPRQLRSTPRASNVAAGTTVRWVNDGRNTHNVTPEHGHATYGSGEPEAGPVVRAHVRRRRARSRTTARCTARPTSGQRAELAVGDAAAATPVRDRWAASDAPAPSFAASGRTIRVPGRRQDHPGRRRPGQAGRPRARVAGRLQGERHHRHRRHRAPRRRPQPHDPRRRVQARQRRVRRRAPTASRSRTSPPATTPRTGSSGTACSATAARTSPRTATATTASTRTTRSTGSSTTRTRRAAPTPASTSASATRATR